VGALRYHKDSHWQRNYSLGIGLSWNLFTGFDSQYKTLESYAAFKNQTYLFHQQQLQVLRDVWSTFHAFQSSVQLLDSAKALESAAKESFIAIRTGYDAGLNSLLDLLSAQKTLSQARVKRIRSQSNLAIHWVQLAYVTGRLQTKDF
jgi:outer membrane protein